MTKDVVHVAFKVAYHDGTQWCDWDAPGYCGVCSPELMKWNVRHRSWCSRSECASVVSGKLSYDELVARYQEGGGPCQESILLRYGEFSPGCTRMGQAKRLTRFFWNGEARPKESFAIFTTVPPGKREEERIIDGLFLVEEFGTLEGGACKEINYVAPGPAELGVWFHEKNAPRWWDHYHNKDGNPNWGAPNYRYIDTETLLGILEEALELVDGPQREEIQVMIDYLNEEISYEDLMFEDDEEEYEYDEDEGFGADQSHSSYSVHGGGEESEAHRELKRFIFDNPEEIGVHWHEIRNRMEEYDGLPTSDRPDLVFELKDGTHVVVEIEVDHPYPGAFQALKYKVLMNATLGENIQSPRVRPWLVFCRETPEAEKKRTIEFCRRYKIRYLAIDCKRKGIPVK